LLGAGLLAGSGAIIMVRHGWWWRGRPVVASGRQISKRLARAPAIGPVAYGAVLGTGVLTIMSTPAVWLGLCCCVAIGGPGWGSAYGASFGIGRWLMLVLDARRSRGKPPAAAGLLALGRQIDPSSRFRLVGLLGGLAVLGAAAATIVPAIA
jgi:hypothetical protein